jgi:nitroreductase
MRKPAQSSLPIHPVLAERWSPRSFKKEVQISSDDVLSIIEAARWAPSTGNSQPWRFLIAHKGQSRFALIAKALDPFNKEWAPEASLFILACVISVNADGTSRPTALVDVGLSLGFLTVEAHHRGLGVHIMSNFDHELVRKNCDLAEDLQPIVILAIGVADDATFLPSERLQELEVAPRQRVPLSELIIL